MENVSSKNILVRLTDSSLQNSLQQILVDVDFSHYSRELVGQAAAVITDGGLQDGDDIPGFIPVVVFHDEDEERLHSYYSHELSPYDRPETIQKEFVRYTEIADISRATALTELPVVNTDTLNELAQIGDFRIVTNGIEQFVRNTTLQLNECRAMLDKKDYDFVRYTFHAIHNNAHNIGAVQMARFASAMEEALMSGNYPNFDAMLELAYTLLSSYEYVTRSWTEPSRTA